MTTAQLRPRKKKVISIQPISIGKVQPINTIQENKPAGKSANTDFISLSDINNLDELLRRIKNKINPDYMKCKIKEQNPKIISLIGKPFYNFIDYYNVNYNNITNDTNFAFLEKKLHKTIKDVKPIIYANFLISETDNDVKKTFLSTLSYTEKLNTQKSLMKLFEDNKINLTILNNQFSLFGKEVEQCELGVATKDNHLMIPLDVVPILRTHASGVFFDCLDKIPLSEEYKNFKKITVNKESYNLLNKSPVFSLVKNSSNMQKVCSVVEEILESKGIPVDVAHKMNYQDFKDLISKHLNNEQPTFNDIISSPKTTPYQQFAYELSNNLIHLSKITIDMKNNGKTQKEIDDYKKRLTKGQFDRQDEIHHNGMGIKYALCYDDPLMVNDISNFTLIKKFTPKNIHDEEHIADNKKVWVIRNGELQAPLSSKTDSIIEGDIVVRFKIKDTIAKNTIYLSEKEAIVSNKYKGCEDYTPYKPKRTPTRKINLNPIKQKTTTR